MEEVWHSCPACEVNAAYPSRLAGQMVACRQCSHAFRLPAPAQSPAIDESLPIAEEDAVNQPIPHARAEQSNELQRQIPGRGSRAVQSLHAQLPVTRQRRGIKWNGITRFKLFTDTTPWNANNSATVVTLPGKADRMTDAAEFFVADLKQAGDGLRLTRPIYREKAVGGRFIRVEAEAGGGMSLIADIAIVQKFDALTITIFKYYTERWHKTERLFWIGLASAPATSFLYFFSFPYVMGVPSKSSVPLVLFIPTIVCLSWAALSFLGRVFGQSRREAASQVSISFSHRLEQSLQVVQNRLSVTAGQPKRSG